MMHSLKFSSVAFNGKCGVQFCPRKNTIYCLQRCLLPASCLLNFHSNNSSSVKAQHYKFSYNDMPKDKFWRFKSLGLIGSCLLTSGLGYWYIRRRKLLCDGSDQANLFSNGGRQGMKLNSSVIESLLYNLCSNVICEKVSSPAGEEIPGLPVYTSSDVAAHDSTDKQIWVSFKSGVYNITQFVPKHPGGDKILMAAGGSLEPFWELFPNHKEPKVLEMLEECRIGNLSSEDRTLPSDNANDPFAAEPRRHPILQPRSQKPFCAEPPMELLVENFITPNELFFVRNHLPVPEVDPTTYELEISGPGIQPITLTLEDLKREFKKHVITSVIQCAGNRRSHLNQVKEVKGLNWGSAGISNAEWGGVKLFDVLKHAGIDFEDPRIKHIQFEGLDTDPANLPYGASIPAEKGLDPNSDILLAYEMNGQELPKDHGYPLRIIVPGVAGARNVKWLGRIIVSEEESKSHWQQNDYKGFSPSVTWDNVDFSKSPAIQELPVTSAICRPSEGSVVSLQDGMIEAAGYAWSGGGRKIVRVDVSADGGKTWHMAEMLQDQSSLYRSWSWTLWSAKIPVPKENCKSGSEVQIICKAVDSSYNVQPDTAAPIWNLRGVLSNAWHRVNFKVK